MSRPVVSKSVRVRVWVRIRVSLQGIHDPNPKPNPIIGLVDHRNGAPSSSCASILSEERIAFSTTCRGSMSALSCV